MDIECWMCGGDTKEVPSAWPGEYDFECVECGFTRTLDGYDMREGDYADSDWF